MLEAHFELVILAEDDHGVVDDDPETWHRVLVA